MKFEGFCGWLFAWLYAINGVSFSFPINLINILNGTMLYTTTDSYQISLASRPKPVFAFFLLSRSWCSNAIRSRFLLVVIWSLLLPLFGKVLGCCNSSRFIKRSSLIAFKRRNKVVRCCWSGYLYKRSVIRVSSSLIWSSILGVMYGSVTARIFSVVFGVMLSIKY